MGNDNSTGPTGSGKIPDAVLAQQLAQHLDFDRLSSDDILAIFSELQTHQMELEVQNDELRQTQVELLQSRQRYTNLYDFAPVGYLTITGKGLIAEANLTACQMLGEERSQLIKRPLNSFFDASDMDRHYLCSRALMHTGEDQTCERLLKRQNGSSSHIQCKCSTTACLDGTDGQFRIILTDISERIQSEKEKEILEQQLRQSQKMEALGIMAGGIAHDFNNIMSAVLGFTDLAINESPEEGPLRGYLEQVITAGIRAKDLVSHILTFSHMMTERTDLVITEIGPVVAEALTFQRSILPSSIEIVSDLDSGSGQIVADPIQIHQIIMNFCTNALHAMKEGGGTLSVALHHRVLTGDDLKSHPSIQPGRFIELSVRDTGCGMAPDIMDKIYDPYFTTKTQGSGSGLGLSVVHGIVKKHGGFLKVKSAVGIGSTFSVFFPAVEREVIAENATTSEKIPTGTEQILFADDEEMLTILGKTALEQWGYKVTTVADGVRALAMFTDEPNRFDIVITDQTMPQMTGENLARRILEIRPDMPIILCTGYCSTLDENKARTLGIKELMLKPVQMGHLATMVRELLDSAKSKNLPVPTNN